jgi:hypothetical protein
MTAKTKKPVGKSGVTAAELKRIALSFPGIVEGSSYGQPSFLLGKKLFTRLRKEDNSIVVIVDSMDERDMLLENEPSLFHITEHYRNYPSVLVRMDKLSVERLQAMLERRWRKMAPKKLQAEASGPTAKRTGSKASRQ